MHHGWMMEVIDDLCDYATKNNLVAAHEVLRLTSVVVNTELQGLVKDAPLQAIDDTANVLRFQPLASQVKC